MATETREQTFHVTGMDCASCATNIEKGVARLDGVTLSSISFTTELLRVEGNIPPERIVARVRELGYDIVDPAAETTADQPTTQRNFLRFLWQRQDTRLALLGALLILPSLLFNELLPMLC